MTHTPAAPETPSLRGAITGQIMSDDEILDHDLSLMRTYIRQRARISVYFPGDAIPHPAFLGSPRLNAQNVGRV